MLNCRQMREEESVIDSLVTKHIFKQTLGNRITISWHVFHAILHYRLKKKIQEVGPEFGE